MERVLGTGQGLYFIVTGLWPFLSMRSFEAVTGPKSDRWLVKTVGALVAVIGSVLLLAVWRGTVGVETAFLAVGSSASLAAIEGAYVARGIISRIYLLDAVFEVLLILAWVSFAETFSGSGR